MFWQKELLRDSVSMTFNQTFELDLPKSGLLGSLVLYAQASPVSAALFLLRKWRLIDYISKIEVIGDGGIPIKSFDGRQALASAFYDDFREPVSMWRTYTATPQRQFIPIHFGRGFLDELYGLDLGRFNQVKLKITNDATSALWTTDITLSVIGFWKREDPSAFAGYFQEEEWKTWLPVANQWEYNQLPIALPIRRVLLRARAGVDDEDCKNNVSFTRQMDDIAFNFRSGQTQVYRGSLEVLGHCSVMEMPALAETRGSIHRQQGYGFETEVGYVTQNLGYGAADADNLTDPLSNMSKDVNHSSQESAYYHSGAPLAWVVRGHGYGHCVPLYYARKPDLADLLEPEPVKQLDVNVHAHTDGTFSGDTAAESAIVLSRLVR